MFRDLTFSLLITAKIIVCELALSSVRSSPSNTQPVCLMINFSLITKPKSDQNLHVLISFPFSGAVASISDASPVHYIVKIELFSLLAKNAVEKYESGVFEAGGYTWYVLFLVKMRLAIPNCCHVLLGDTLSSTVFIFYYLLCLHCKEIGSLSKWKQGQECKRLHLSLFSKG